MQDFILAGLVPNQQQDEHCMSVAEYINKKIISEIKGKK